MHKNDKQLNNLPSKSHRNCVRKKLKVGKNQMKEINVTDMRVRSFISKTSQKIFKTKKQLV